jgi:hypothetical protein
MSNCIRCARDTTDDKKRKSELCSRCHNDDYRRTQGVPRASCKRCGGTVEGRAKLCAGCKGTCVYCGENHGRPKGQSPSTACAAYKKMKREQQGAA